MAGNPTGFNFQPGSGDIRGGGAPTPTQAPISPVQTLSFNLPTQTAQGAIAPQSLLQGQGASGSGLPNTQLLQMLMRIFQPQGGGAAGSTPPGLSPGRVDNGPQDYAPGAGPQGGGWGDLGGQFGTPRIIPGDQFTARPVFGGTLDQSAGTQGVSPAPEARPQAPYATQAPAPSGGGFGDWLSGENNMNGRPGVSPLF